MNEFRVLNDKGDIEVKILKPANAVFQTDEFSIDSAITVYKNAFNIFDLVFENQQLKERIGYLERSNDRREDTILEQRQEISDLEDRISKAIELLNNFNFKILIDNRTMYIRLKDLEQGKDLLKLLEEVSDEYRR